MSQHATCLEMSFFSQEHYLDSFVGIYSLGAAGGVLLGASRHLLGVHLQALRRVGGQLGRRRRPRIAHLLRVHAAHDLQGLAEIQGGVEKCRPECREVLIGSSDGAVIHHAMANGPWEIDC